jgi:integrase
MRRNEVARLNRNDVDDGRASQALITGKGNRERVVFFDDDTREAIRTYVDARNDAYGPLFIRHRGSPKSPGRGGENLRLTPQAIWKLVKAHAATVGVAATTHDFRHLKATTLLNRGANLSEVQDILGHASPDTTKRIYAHYETGRLREVFDLYSQSVEDAAKRARRQVAPTSQS